MKIIKPSYEIMTDISPFGTLELESIERAARVCYKSEDKITDQAESAKKLIRKLIENGHEAMLEHGGLTVKFICDRVVSHELVRHRMASFAQESTRYCNYSQDKFGNEITFIQPIFVEDSFMNEDKTDAADLWKACLYPKDYVTWRRLR
jgi:thymidylate synthase (FAD)